ASGRARWASRTCSTSATVSSRSGTGGRRRAWRSSARPRSSRSRRRLIVTAAKEVGRRLFNGRDLDGWEHVGPGQFVIEEGLLKTDGGMCLLWYTRERFAR